MLGHRGQRLAQQEHRGGLVAHVAVVAHRDPLGAESERVDRPVRAQGGGEAGGHAVRQHPLAPDRLR